MGDFFVVRAVRQPRRRAATSSRSSSPATAAVGRSGSRAATAVRRSSGAARSSAARSGADWREERRPVPGKPHIAHDHFIVVYAALMTVIADGRWCHHPLRRRPAAVEDVLRGAPSSSPVHVRGRELRRVQVREHDRQPPRAARRARAHRARAGRCALSRVRASSSRSGSTTPTRPARCSAPAERRAGERPDRSCLGAAHRELQRSGRSRLGGRSGDPRAHRRVHPLGRHLRRRVLVQGLRRGGGAPPRADRGAHARRRDPARCRLRHGQAPRAASGLVRGQRGRPRPGAARDRDASGSATSSSSRRHDRRSRSVAGSTSSRACSARSATSARWSGSAGDRRDGCASQPRRAC